MDKKRLPKKIIAQVREYKKILRAEKLPMQGFYIFGSYAKGTQGKWSDIDVLVVSPKFKNSWHGLTYLMKRVPDGLWSIEPHGLNPKEFSNKYSTLATEVKEHGIKV
jgi:predicted nucleotidyltransferase